jgi:hypothetical protein
MANFFSLNDEDFIIQVPALEMDSRDWLQYYTSSEWTREGARHSSYQIFDDRQYYEKPTKINDDITRVAVQPIRCVESGAHMYSLDSTYCSR